MIGTIAKRAGCVRSRIICNSTSLFANGEHSNVSDADKHGAFIDAALKSLVAMKTNTASSEWAPLFQACISPTSTR